MILTHILIIYSLPNSMHIFSTTSADTTSLLQDAQIFVLPPSMRTLCRLISLLRQFSFHFFSSDNFQFSFCFDLKTDFLLRSKSHCSPVHQLSIIYHNYESTLVCDYLTKISLHLGNSTTMEGVFPSVLLVTDRVSRP